MTLKDGLICLLDGRTGNNNDTIWKDLSGNENDFVLQNWTFNNDNKWTGYSIKKSKNGGVIQFKDGKLSNVRSIIMKVKVQDFSYPSYLIDLRPEVSSGWIYSGITNSSDGIGGNFVRTLKYTEDGLERLDNNPDKMVSDKFVCYYMEIDNNTDCHVFLGSRHSLDEKFSGEIKNVYIYNRPLSDEEIMKLCKDGLLLKEYVNENNLPTIVNKLMDASNIKIANNKYGNRVQTVIDKIVEKADNVTKAINQEVINIDYSFKVGAGTNVDVSSDVQDGFSNITIKGNTYQNLINTNSNIFFAGSSRYENRTNTNNKKEVKALSDGSMVLYKDGMFKDNTTYTVVANVFVSRNTQVGFSFKSDINFTQGLKYLSPIKVGDYATYIVQITTTTNCTSVVIGNHGAFLTNDVFGIEKLMVFEGDFTTNNPNLPAYFEGIVGVGDKSKNLFNGKLEKAIIDVNGFVSQHPNPIASVDFIKVKPNTTYIISMPTQVNKYIHTYDRNFNVLNQINTQAVFTTPNNCEYIKFNTHSNTVIEITEPVQIEEGTVATSYEPYYKGYKTEILSTNDLLLINDEYKNGYYGDDDGIFRPTNNGDFSTNLIRIDSDKVMLTLLKDISKAPPGYGKICCYDNSKNFIKLIGPIRWRTPQSGVFNLPNNTKYIGVTLLWLNKAMTWQLTSSTSATISQKNKTQILLDEPLMRLPNGVCDEITKDGRLIRRIGKYTFTGKEQWVIHTQATTTRFRINIKEFNINKANKRNAIGYCNNILLMPNWNWNVDIELIEDDATFISIRKAISTVEEFKTWISTNSITIYYELETPVITDIIPPSVRIFKDGYLTFNTLVAPESTHLVQLNKSAQINNTLEQVQFLNKKVDALDIIYNSLIFSTSNTLSNLNK